jgi:hypothetical protein
VKSTEYGGRLVLSGEAGPIYADQLSLMGHRDVIGWQRGELSCAEMDRDTANDIIRRNHYSGKVYNASYIHLGAYWRGDLVGVAQYGYAMNPTSQGSVVEGTGPREYLELNRLWLDDIMPGNSESAFLALTLRYIRATTPVAWVQSFADERCRRFGAVYQACSFDYVGEHTATFWEIDGDWFHNSLITTVSEDKLYPQARYAQANKHRATRHELRQFRYIKFLRKSFRTRLLLNVQPYPKPENTEAGPTP